MKAEEQTRRKMFRHGGVGLAIQNDKIRQQRQMSVKMVGVADSQAARSVLEQTSLDEFIASADLARQSFDGNRGNHLLVVVCCAQLVSSGPAPLSTADQERVAAARRVQVPIPRRPHWHEGISHDELAGLEGEAFLNWRRCLAHIEEKQGLVMTPYEKNLEFWRQLWRCVERADLLVQILDARDPEFYRCHDLERYVSEFDGKRTLLLINKADFLSPDLRRRWATHFAAAGVDHIFFSALRELHRQETRSEKVGSRTSACRRAALCL
jgi:large subunit GTPase 1